MTASAKAFDPELAQRVAEATPERMVAMLLEVAQRFLAQAVSAMHRNDPVARGQAVNRVYAIIEELAARLNLEQGGDLAGDLDLIYEWWSWELLHASAKQEPSRLERMSGLMGELRSSWEQLDQSKLAARAMTA